MKRLQWIAGLAVLASLILFVQAGSKGGFDASHDLIVDRGNGLTWVSDSHYPATVRSGYSVIIPRSQAEDFIARMNQGEFENFGFSDWRLPTRDELEYAARSAAFGVLAGDLADLKQFLASSAEPTGITARKGNDLTYTWPVRFQDDTGGGTPAEPSQRVILAFNSAVIRKDSSVTGDVFAATALGATLRTGFELAIDLNSTVDGSVRADRLQLEPGASVTGDAEANVLDNLGTIGGMTSPCGPPCLLPALPFFFPATGTLTNNQNVANNASLTLAAGDYGDVTLGRNSTLCLTGGIYNIKSLTSGRDSNILFDAPSDLRIEGKVTANNAVLFGPSNCDAGGPTELPAASDIIVYVSGINGTGGGLAETPPALWVGGTGSVIAANFFVPNGLALVDKGSSYTGSIIAHDVNIDRGSVVTVDSYFVGANQAPIANGQTVFADASGQTTIIITATDPEGSDLTFSIVSGPTAPNSLILTEGPPPAPGDPVGCDPEVEGDCTTPPVPNRTSATVVFNGSGPDSFVFRATDTSGASGQATVFIDPDNTRESAPPPLAQDVSVSTPDGVPVSFQLKGNSGGTTSSSSIASRVSIGPRAAFFSPASVAGGVFDTDGDGFGDAADDTSDVVRVFKSDAVLYFSADSDGNGLYRLDRFTGAATSLGASGVNSSTVGLTESPNPTVLYGSRPFGFTEINADGSGATVVDSSSATGTCDGFPCPAYEGLATDPSTGTVYGIINGTFGIVNPSNGDLVTVLASAEFCDNGTEATCDIEGIAYGNGGVYGLVGDNGPSTGDSTVDDLFFYNPGTDSWSVVGPTGIDWDLVGLAYDPGQNLLYAKGSQDSNLYSINPSTGATTLVGDTGIAAGGGLALVPASVGRVQIEVDASACNTPELQTANLVLSVTGAPADATFFFTGSGNQDEMLTADDFEAPVNSTGGFILGGTETGTISINVYEQVIAALSAPGSNGIFSVSGRVDESADGTGLGIFSAASTSTPGLSCTTPGLVAPSLRWTIFSLPSAGTLTDSLGNTVMINDSYEGPPEPVLTYHPELVGVFTFQVVVEDLFAMVSDIATVTVTVEPDECTIVGRPIGCQPNP